MDVHQVKDILESELDDPIQNIKELYTRSYYKIFEVNINNLDYILRIVSKDNVTFEQTSHTIKHEFDILKFLNSKRFPVPRVKLCNPTSPKYLLAEKIEGMRLKDSWHFLSDQSRVQIAQQLGGFFEDLHSLDLPIDSWDTHHNWQDFIINRIEASLDYVREKNLISESLKTKVDSFVSEHQRKIPSETKQVLLHNDLNPQNILISGYEEDEPILKGIIDWEWSFIGSHRYEFVELASLFFNQTRIIEAFNSSYKFKIPTDWVYERKLYLIDKFLQQSQFHHKNKIFSNQKHRLLKFMLSAMI